MTVLYGVEHTRMTPQGRFSAEPTYALLEDLEKLKPHTVGISHMPEDDWFEVRMHLSREVNQRKIELDMRLEHLSYQDRYWTQLATYCIKKGYFELFITAQQGTHVRGTIEDFLGSAKFEGEFTDGRFNFSKKYIRASVEALVKNIQYLGIAAHGDIIRYYDEVFFPFMGAFYMTRNLNEKSIAMAMNFYDALEENSNIPRIIQAEQLAVRDAF